MSTWNPKVNEIFLDALELESDKQRSEFLTEACGDDASLRAEVESLLRADKDAPSMFDRAGHCLTMDTHIEERVGDAIGPYTLREQIGEGGMGVVYVAEQTKPVRRKVALKIIKAGLATKEITSRFEAERQALAMMDHPHIAKVFDGGVDQHDRPYIVMELVQGFPIGEFCDQHRMSTEKRLKRFVDVCRAVEHAHQKGIIHRDLKPSNVLVAEIDDAAVPKVIDFGVAKAIGQELIDQTLYTSFTQMIGTPLYMSPEQTRMGVVDVDTRSDVYSLGVMLYELLTGTTPFASEDLKKVGFDEMRRIIQEDEPSRPSKQVSTLADKARSTTAQRRSIDHRQLSNLLKGELDWIVMKALAKDRNRRYQSAGELAEDIERYLNNEPVEAHPPSLGYRFSKMVHRNIGLVSAVAVVVLCLIGGIVGTTWGMVQARRERDAARIAQGNEETQRQRAERATEAEKAVLEFVEKRIIGAGNPNGHGGDLGYDATVRQAVHSALPFLATSFDDQPLLKARLHETIGMFFLALGEGELAVRQCEASYAIHAAQLGPDDPTTLHSMMRLAFGHDEVGNYKKALELKETVRSRQREILGPNHPATVESLINIAVTYARQQRFDKAVDLFEKALALLNSIPEADREAILACKLTLATSYRNLGRFAEAAEQHEQALELSKEINGADHPDTLGTMHELAHSYQAINRHPEAHALLQQVFNLLKEKIGPVHPDTVKTGHCLANSHMGLSNHKDAKETFEAILQQQKANLGHNHPATLLTMSKLAISYYKLGEYEEAAQRHKEVFQLRRDRLGENDPATLASLGEMALCQEQFQQYDEAIKIFESLLSKFQEIRGPNHRETLMIMNNLAKTCWTAERIEDAVRYYEDAINRMETSLGRQDRVTVGCKAYYAWLLTTKPDYPDRALELAQEMSQIAPQNPWHLQTLGAAQLRNAQYDKAIDSLTHSLKLRSNAGDCMDYFLLAIAEAQRGNRDDAMSLYEKATNAMSQDPNQENPEFVRYRAEAREVLGIDTTDPPTSDNNPSNGAENDTQKNLDTTNESI